MEYSYYLTKHTFLRLLFIKDRTNDCVRFNQSLLTVCLCGFMHFFHQKKYAYLHENLLKT